PRLVAGASSGPWGCITKLKPVGGFAAETAGGITLVLNSAFGVPVSTTHVITGAITGVGFTRGAGAVRWGIAQRIVWAWILTIHASALVAALCRLRTTSGRRLSRSLRGAAPRRPLVLALLLHVAARRELLLDLSRLAQVLFEGRQVLRRECLHV